MQSCPLQIASIAPHRILIVEDEGIVASDLASSLVRLGYEVAGIAESAEAAMAKISAGDLGLILMDIRIKGAMDGIETAAAVRRRFDIPLIYMTAHSDKQTIDRAKMTGASGFLTKPFHQTTLANSIEMAIYRHRADRIRQKAWEATVRAHNHYSALAEFAKLLAAEKSRYHALVEATSKLSGEEHRLCSLSSDS